MITLSPNNDKDYISAMFHGKGIAKTKNSGCVTALDGDRLLGFCLYDLSEKCMTVKYIEPLNNIALADGILRSTLHVAVENGITDAFYDDTLPEDFLRIIGFIEDSQNKRLNINKLFESCCGCK